MARRIGRQDTLFFVLLICSACGHFALGFIGSNDGVVPPELLARERGENTVRVQLMSTVKTEPVPPLPPLLEQPEIRPKFAADKPLPEFVEQVERQVVTQRVMERNVLDQSAPQSKTVQKLFEPVSQVDLQEQPEPENRVTRHEIELLDFPPEQAAEVPAAAQREGNASQDLVNEGSQGAKVPPQLKAENKDPVYPANLLNREVQGRVVLLVAVLPTGRVGEISVHQTSGYVELDKAASEAVALWRFSPGTRNGQAETMNVLVPVTFKVVREKRGNR